ncbi:MAG TPA: MFS transporter [Lacipirellulaceae bacterium]|jgi:nucleoside transporter|nr:MFS transporter [Lacipirellulaceae bacterium]
MADSSITVEATPNRSSPALIARMSAMMFLQYWPLGTWGVTFGTYIAANTGGQGTQLFSSGFVGYSTAAGAIGSLISPVIIGFISDRYFSADRLVVVMHAGCAVAAWGMFQCQSQLAFFAWLLFYYQCFSPSGALINKIALRHLADVNAEYPAVRLYGTIGWIAAGLFIGLGWQWMVGASIEATRVPFLIGAAGNIVMALYALTLPHTPTELKSGNVLPSAFRDSRELIRNRPLMAFLLVTLLACVPTMAYNNYGNLFLNNQGYSHAAALMTLGQVSEVLVLTATPWLIARFDLAPLFAGGIMAWCVRYLLLVIGSYCGIAWPIVMAIGIHGFCYVFIYIIGVMYVDRLVRQKHRGAAQGMYAIASAGVGNLFGALAVGINQSVFLTPDGVAPAPYNWPAFWIMPAIISAAALLAYADASRLFARAHKSDEPQ